MSRPGDDMLAKAAEAAGALALQLDLASGTARLSGAAGALGLECDASSDFLSCVAPSDRKALTGHDPGAVDVRLRLAPPGGEVRYVRLLGVREGMISPPCCCRPVPAWRGALDTGRRGRARSRPR